MIEQWIANYWWLVFGLVTAGTLIAFRMRKRGGTEHVLRRAIFAAFPSSDPALASRAQLSGRSALLVALAVLAISLAYLFFIQSN